MNKEVLFMPSKKTLKMKVDCPRCWVQMVQKDEEIFGPNITIDICPKCAGIWLDGGELKKVLGDRKLSNYLAKDIGTKSESQLICPRCKNLMDLENADDLYVDVCLECNGVWLDAGEMEGLRKKSEDGFEADEAAKAVERYEEMKRYEDLSLLDRFLKKIHG